MINKYITFLYCSIISFLKSIKLLFLLALMVFSLCDNVFAHELDGQHHKVFSESDIKTIKVMMSYVDDEKWNEALQEALKIKDPIAKESVYWMKYSSSNSNSEDLATIRQFYRKHKTWPDSHLIRSKVEMITVKSLIKDKSKQNAKDVLAWFNRFPPKTLDAKKAFAEARLLRISKNGKITKKQKSQIKKLIKDTWLSGKFSRQEQRKFIKKYNQYLNHADYVTKVDKLLWQKKIIHAKDLFPKLSKSWKTVFKARIAMIEKHKSISKEYYAIPKKMRNNSSLLYDRIMWHYKKNNTKRAVELLQTVNRSMPYQSKWWKLRKLIIRQLIEDRKYTTAYKLAYSHYNKSITSRSEARWLSGWLALRFLHNNKKAYKHFYDLYRDVRTPISKSRAAYWSARSAEANRNSEVARKWYKVAAMHPDTFYGQLASISAGSHKIKIGSTPKITKQDISAYSNNKFLKMAFILSESKKYGLARRFIHHAVSTAKTKGQIELLTQFGNQMGKLNLSVEASKKASWRHGKITENGYPIIKNFAKFNKTKLESPLAHAIIRQESLFDKKALSHAGAMGLMQLMPQTAKLVAKQMKVNYSKAKLKKSPALNLKLGSFYLNGLINEWDGSYILAIASYNAGPHNVKKWIKKFGDPRKKKNLYQVIDWMESIPFYETRNYVQRVMENLQIYRSIIKKQKVNIDLIKHDLVLRGKK